MSSSSPPVYDAIVIGAGFGGLGAALGLANQGTLRPAASTQAPRS
jgi:succinate dehydrogenase/fumarate reductase flavoprotein subunit